MKKVLGIDVGGTGIKGAIVDLDSGELLTDRIKLKTQKPATPKSVLRQVKELIDRLGYKGDLMGIGFPSVIKNGKSLTAANIDPSWIDFDIQAFFKKELGKKVVILNDADAAGLAEFTYSKSISREGLTIFLTIGTGIGSAVFYNGVLIPNTEFGHVKFRKTYAEKYVSNYAREVNDLSWEKWGKELNVYLKHIEFILRPDAFILGGGVSKKLHKYQKFLTTDTPISSATLLNQAGVIGAAIAADKQLSF